jgi:hypothetical protein
LGESQPKGARILAPRLNPPHAQKTMQSNLKSPDGHLEKPNRLKARGARQQVHGFAKHFDKFLDSYASALGKGAAGLTIAAAVGLLHQAGVGREIIESIWQHLKHH